MQGEQVVADLDALRSPLADASDFGVLARQIHDLIQHKQPDARLDRPHMFLVKYICILCEKHGLTVDREKPLHSHSGEYLKRLQEQNLIES